MMIKGCIFYEASDTPIRDGIISSKRPVIIVSHRMYGDVVQVVPLTTSETRFDNRKNHVIVDVNGTQSVALCEQIRTVTMNELSRYPKGVCSKEEISAIDAALAEILFKGEIIDEEE